MVDRREEFPDVTFEYPDRLRPVTRHFPRKHLESAECAVRPLALAARVRIGNEDAVEERREDPVERAVDDPVAHARLVDVARLRIVHLERLVDSVPVGFRDKLGVEVDEVLHETELECLYVFPRTLAARKFLPRFEEIFERDDIGVLLFQYFFHMSSQNTPPAAFASA